MDDELKFLKLRYIVIGAQLNKANRRKMQLATEEQIAQTAMIAERRALRTAEQQVQTDSFLREPSYHSQARMLQQKDIFRSHDLRLPKRLCLIVLSKNVMVEDYKNPF